MGFYDSQELFYEAWAMKIVSELDGLLKPVWLRIGIHEEEAPLMSFGKPAFYLSIFGCRHNKYYFIGDVVDYRHGKKISTK